MQLSQLPERYRRQAEEQLGINRPTPNVTCGSLFKNQPSVAEGKKVHGIISAKKKVEATAKKPQRTKPTLTPDQADTIVKSVTVSDDGNEVKIILNVSPAALPTAQQKGAFVGKDGRVHFYTKAKVAKAEKALTKALSPYAHLTKKWGDDVALAVSVVFCFPYPVSTPKKKMIQFGYHTKRSDVDNIFKGFGDALTNAGFWVDDSVIADLHLRKILVIDEPRIGVRIRNLTPKQEELFDASNTGQQEG